MKPAAEARGNPPVSRREMAMAPENYFIFCKNRVLVRKGTAEIRPFSTEWPIFQPLAETVLPVGKNPEAGNFAVELKSDKVPDSAYEWVSLRSLVGRIDDAAFNLWGKASQILNWHKGHHFCGRCGGKTVDHESEQAKVCPSCSLIWYPRISPCIIVLISRGHEVLLARSPRFTKGMYSVLAGFIEPGESVESTLRREIAEEVDLRIKNIRYFGSQPWPFPGQLMLGFLADYDSGKLHIDGIEIIDAGWYHADNLPMIPGEGTIAGRMIRHHLASCSQELRKG